MDTKQNIEGLNALKEWLWGGLDAEMIGDQRWPGAVVAGIAALELQAEAELPLRERIEAEQKRRGPVDYATWNPMWGLPHEAPEIVLEGENEQASELCFRPGARVRLGTHEGTLVVQHGCKQKDCWRWRPDGGNVMWSNPECHLELIPPAPEPQPPDASPREWGVGDEVWVRGRIERACGHANLHRFYVRLPGEGGTPRLEAYELHRAPEVAPDADGVAVRKLVAWVKGEAKFRYIVLNNEGRWRANARVELPEFADTLPELAVKLGLEDEPA